MTYRLRCELECEAESRGEALHYFATFIEYDSQGLKPQGIGGCKGSVRIEEVEEKKIMSDIEQIETLKARIRRLEEAITEASLGLCESQAPEAMAAIKVFDRVMDAAARKRMGI